MITLQDFTQDTINIFTDASILKTKNEDDIGCPGFSTFIDSQFVEHCNDVIVHTTNNFCEIRAIRMAVYRALLYSQQYPNKTINIISDSKISIFGLREWSYKWFLNNRDGVLSSTSGVVKNQEEFIMIIYMILTNHLKVNFYHVRGHHDHNTFKEFVNFKQSFRRENKLTEDVSDQLIKFLIAGNSNVDNGTRVPLENRNHEIETAMQLYDYNSVMQFDYREIVQFITLCIEYYFHLIGGLNNE